MLSDDEINAIDLNAPGFKAELKRGWYFVDSVIQLHEQLRHDFETHILNSGPTAEAQVASRLTTSIVSQIRPIMVLEQNGFDAQAFALIRTCEESASNLYYILFAGPHVEGRTSADLAEQFLGYRYVDHARIISKWRSEYEAKYQAGQTFDGGPKTLQDFKAFCDEKLEKSRTVLKNFPKMDRRSWHTTNKEDRSKEVLKHLPEFASSFAEAWTSSASMTSLQNFILHGSPMNFPEAVSEGRMLHIEPPLSDGSPRAKQSLTASIFAVACWFALGNLLGHLPLVHESLEQITTESLKNIEQKHRVQLMWNIDNLPNY